MQCPADRLESCRYPSVSLFYRFCERIKLHIKVSNFFLLFLVHHRQLLEMSHNDVYVIFERQVLHQTFPGTLKSAPVILHCATPRFQVTFFIVQWHLAQQQAIGTAVFADDKLLRTVFPVVIEQFLVEV